MQYHGVTLQDKLTTNPTAPEGGLGLAALKGLDLVERTQVQMFLLPELQYNLFGFHILQKGKKKKEKK